MEYEAPPIAVPEFEHQHENIENDLEDLCKRVNILEKNPIDSDWRSVVDNLITKCNELTERVIELENKVPIVSCGPVDYDSMTEEVLKRWPDQWLKIWKSGTLMDQEVIRPGDDIPLEYYRPRATK